MTPSDGVWNGSTASPCVPAGARNCRCAELILPAGYKPLENPCVSTNSPILSFASRPAVLGTSLDQFPLSDPGCISSSGPRDLRPWPAQRRGDVIIAARPSPDRPGPHRYAPPHQRRPCARSATNACRKAGCTPDSVSPFFRTSDSSLSVDWLLGRETRDFPFFVLSSLSAGVTPHPRRNLLRPFLSRCVRLGTTEPRKFLGFSSTWP